MPSTLAKHSIRVDHDLEMKTRDGVVLRGQSTLSVYVGGLMFAATNCRDVVGYDLKLSCADAVRLLSNAVLDCDADNNPLWKVRDRLFPASAALILENGDIQ